MHVCSRCGVWISGCMQAIIHVCISRCMPLCKPVLCLGLDVCLNLNMHFYNFKLMHICILQVCLSVCLCAFSHACVHFCVHLCVCIYACMHLCVLALVLYAFIHITPCFALHGQYFSHLCHCMHLLFPQCLHFCTFSLMHVSHGSASLYIIGWLFAF